MQYYVDVLRQTGDKYSAAFYDVNGTKLGEGAKGLHNNGETLILKPTGSTLSYTSLIIIRTGEMSKGGTKGSRLTSYLERLRITAIPL